MKTKKLLTLVTLLITLCINAQIKTEQGVELINSAYSRIHHIIGSDEHAFYALRILNYPQKTAVYIDKYDQHSMSVLFQTELKLNLDQFKVESSLLVGDKILFFYREFNKSGNLTGLNLYILGSDGKIVSNNTISKIENLKSENVDFEIIPNPSKTKFLLRSTIKTGDKSGYKTDFSLYSFTDLNVLWTKSVNKPIIDRDNENMKPGEELYLGIYLDDNDNIYYASQKQEITTTETKSRFYLSQLMILPSTAQKPQYTDLQLDDKYQIDNIQFYQKENNLIIGGFYRDQIEYPATDWNKMKCGAFVFQINTQTLTLQAKQQQAFDANTMAQLQIVNETARNYNFKTDKILSIENDIYLLGEQYETRYSSKEIEKGKPENLYSTFYQDVIIAKINPANNIEWIKNIPIRTFEKYKAEENDLENHRTPVFMPYAYAVFDKSIYIFNNENLETSKALQKPNIDPAKLKFCEYNRGSDLMYTSVSTTGEKKHQAVYRNINYCYAPLSKIFPSHLYPSFNSAIFLCKPEEVIIYTEDKNRDRWMKLQYQPESK